MKKRWIAGTVFGCAVLILAGCAYAAANGFLPWNRLKWQTDSGEAVAAYVNGEPILQKTVDKTAEDARRIDEVVVRLFPSKQRSSNSKSEVLDGLIKAKVLEQEAKKEGITVTDEDALNSLHKTDRQVQDMLKNGSEDEKANAKEVLDTMSSITSALHETMDEYEREIVPTERNILIQNQLYQEYVSEHSSMTETKQQMWDDYVSELMKKADVKRANEK